jgi:hypothetical protein
MGGRIPAMRAARAWAAHGSMRLGYMRVGEREARWLALATGHARVLSGGSSKRAEGSCPKRSRYRRGGMAAQGLWRVDPGCAHESESGRRHPPCVYVSAHVIREKTQHALYTIQQTPAPIAFPLRAPTTSVGTRRQRVRHALRPSLAVPGHTHTRGQHQPCERGGGMR